MQRGGKNTQSSRGGGGGRHGRFVNRHHSQSPGAAQSNDVSRSGESRSAEVRQASVAQVEVVAKQLRTTLISDYQPESISAPGRLERLNRVPTRSDNNVQNSEGQRLKQWGSPSSVDLSREARSTFSITTSDRGSPSDLICTPPVNTTHGKEMSPNVHLGCEDGIFPQGVQGGNSVSGDREYKGEQGKLDNQHKVPPFDICLTSTGNVVKLKSPIFAHNRAKRNDKKRQDSGGDITILRPGLVLLKGYLSLSDQVKLVKSCRDLGLGPGGFYQPGYRDGANLLLKMMCLGKNWDPETSSYSDVRPFDGSKPPPIPDEFHRIVTGAVQVSHDYLKSQPQVRNPKDVLPSMSPNICIVNYYSKTGKLGLHQDKDESQESLRRGLPVVSFSVGDTAEFLYGDERDIFKAEKVLLESGDILIFGGKSRHIFHGVASIKPDTTPKALSDETSLRPGRLNLTFREY